MTATPDTLTLSHSQLENWQQCPRKWAFAKVDRAPQAPSEALIFGDAVHQAIEADGRAAVASARRLGVPDLVRVFSRALFERLTADDPHQLLAHRVAAMRVKGLATLRAYHEQFAGVYHPTAVEAPFPMVELPALHTGGSAVRFTGRIDALSGEHGETIVDFKTGKPWAPGIEHQKPQAAAYLWAMRAAGAEVARVKFVILSTLEAPMGLGAGLGGASSAPPAEITAGRAAAQVYDTQVDIRVTSRSTQQLDAYAAQVQATAGEIARALARKEFPANPGPLCGWCQVLASCSDGQRWLRSRQRTPAVPLVDESGPLAWEAIAR